MVDPWKDFWIRETGTGQQVAQLHERYDDDDDDDDGNILHSSTQGFAVYDIHSEAFYILFYIHSVKTQFSLTGESQSILIIRSCPFVTHVRKILHPHFAHKRT